ncbi:MAG: AmmeMemoRadiSam system protein B [Clostridiales bacterium]|nr:AmmeMemoRadiSam system protein B [Clostridiales bacterium]
MNGRLKTNIKKAVACKACIAALAVQAALSACTGTAGVASDWEAAALEQDGKVAFTQTQAIDARPFLSESELLKSVSEECWEAFGLGKPDGLASVGEKPIRGVVVPHHAAAAALSAYLISRLAESQPPAVIILAPNHYNTGAEAITAASDFMCHSKRVSAGTEAAERLGRAGLVSISDEPFKREHSIGMLLPIIAWYLPDAEVIPVIFHHGADEGRILAVLHALSPEIEAGAVVVASIDFSHYLTWAEAVEKDRETRGYLENGDAAAISKLDSSYVDSPTVMAAMLMHFGTEGMEIVANTNSGILMNNPVSPCTSYFAIQFR